MSAALALSEVDSTRRYEAFDACAIGSRKVIIATNGASRSKFISNVLRNRGHQFAIAESTQAAVGMLQCSGISMVVTALSDEDPDGLLLTRLIRGTIPDAAVILITCGNVENIDYGLECAIGEPNETRAPSSDEVGRFASLSNRERQVLDLVVNGCSNKIVAYKLSISPRTVENHRARVMSKMRVRSVAELVRLAMSVTEPTNNVIHWPNKTKSASDRLSVRG